MKIVFATNNENKLREVQQLLPSEIQVLGLKDIECYEDIPETAETIEENAILKAQYIFDKYQCNVFADDTGLEVKALNNEPSVHSARYAGNHKNNQDNIRLLLANMKGKEERAARFKTSFALILEGNLHTFEGIIEGIITDKERGTNGFGYDAVFQPKGYDKTFAELSPKEKNEISHRGIATQKLISFLHKEEK